MLRLSRVDGIDCTHSPPVTGRIPKDTSAATIGERLGHNLISATIGTDYVVFP